MEPDHINFDFVARAGGSGDTGVAGLGGVKGSSFVLGSTLTSSLGVLDSTFVADSASLSGISDSGGGEGRTGFLDFSLVSLDRNEVGDKLGSCELILLSTSL